MRAGHEESFDKARLRELYQTHSAYARAVADNVARLVATRVLMKQDGDDLIEEAKKASIP